MSDDHALIDKYRDPKSGLFSFPDDAAAHIEALEAERDAAYRRGLEDAAKVADGWADTFAGHEPQHIPAQVYALGAVEDIAAAIRALNRTSTEQETDTPIDTPDLPHQPSR